MHFCLVNFQRSKVMLASCNQLWLMVFINENIKEINEKSTTVVSCNNVSQGMLVI